MAMTNATRLEFLPAPNLIVRITRDEELPHAASRSGHRRPTLGTVESRIAPESKALSGERPRGGTGAAGAPAGCIVSLHGDMICSRFRRNNALDSVSDLDKSNIRAQGETAR